MTELNSELLSDWLSWAGARLLALPSERIKPAEPRSCWPDYKLDPYQILQFRAGLKFRVSPPTKDEIPIMEEILLFPNYCDFVLRRRVLHLRLLTSPITANPIYSWNKVSRVLNTSVNRSKRLHSLALREAADKIPNDSVRSVSDYFGTAAGLNV